MCIKIAVLTQACPACFGSKIHKNAANAVQLAAGMLDTLLHGNPHTLRGPQRESWTGRCCSQGSPSKRMCVQAPSSAAQQVVEDSQSCYCSTMQLADSDLLCTYEPGIRTRAAGTCAVPLPWHVKAAEARLRPSTNFAPDITATALLPGCNISSTTASMEPAVYSRLACGQHGR